MLVLSRQRDETIMIGDEIEMTIVDIRGDKVRIGITAPPRITVHRKEIYEAIMRENEAAAASDSINERLFAHPSMAHATQSGTTSRSNRLAVPTSSVNQSSPPKRQSA